MMVKNYLKKFVYSGLENGIDKNYRMDNKSVAAESSELVSALIRGNLEPHFAAKRIFFLNIHMLCNQFGEEAVVDMFQSREHFAEIRDIKDPLKLILNNQKDIFDVLTGERKGLSFKRTFGLFSIFFYKEEALRDESC